MMFVLGGFVVRMLFVLGAITVAGHFSWVSKVPLGLTIVVTHLGLLAWETRHLSISLAYPRSQASKRRRVDAARVGSPARNATCSTGPRSGATARSAINKVVLLFIVSADHHDRVLHCSGRKGSLVPTGIQNVAEMAVEFVENQIIMQTMGPAGPAVHCRS